MNAEYPRVVLEIKHLVRSDAANYTLYGKTKDGFNSISIALEVKDKPYVLLNNSKILHKIGTQHTLECHAGGFPIPMVWWKWKRCEETEDCIPGSKYEWKDVESNGNFPNRENVTLEHSNVKNFSLVSYLHLTAKQSGHYTCVANNTMGKDDKITPFIVTVTDNRDASKNGLTTGEITAVAVFGVVAVVLVCVVSCLVQRIREKKKQKKELDFIGDNDFERGHTDIFNPNLPLEEQIDLLPYKHNCEFPKNRLKLGKTLGQGAFGRVVKAEAIGLVKGEASTTVAVKMLKEAADMEQRKALIAELKILIHIGKHLNIVNLLGAVTKKMSKGNLYVIVEYCCFGNLRHFLLKNKSAFLNQLDHRSGQVDPQISTLPGSPVLSSKENVVTYPNILRIGMDSPSYRDQSLNSAHQVTNDLVTGTSVCTHLPGSSARDRCFRSSLPSMTTDTNSETCSEEIGKKQFITTRDLLSFAFQCARGMKYLASRKLIHRDLAARNVLLAKDKVVKICDFGLAKDCYKYSNYINKTGGLLPVRWMAIESICDRVFTTKSDVWSFGILLWEMFTLGSNPYPGVEVNEDFFKKLRNGYRMEKPEFAPKVIYQMMRNCWLDDPNHRPDFSHLVRTIGALLEERVKKYYVELNEPYEVMNMDFEQNKNDYLQMAGDITEDYTNVSNAPDPVTQTEDVPSNTYENIQSIRPIDNGPEPKISIELEPMIQLQILSQSSKSEDLNSTRMDTDANCMHPSASEKDDIDYLQMAGVITKDYPNKMNAPDLLPRHQAHTTT